MVSGCALVISTKMTFSSRGKIVTVLGFASIVNKYLKQNSTIKQGTLCSWLSAIERSRGSEVQ